MATTNISWFVEYVNELRASIQKFNKLNKTEKTGEEALNDKAVRFLLKAFVKKHVANIKPGDNGNVGSGDGSKVTLAERKILEDLVSDVNKKSTAEFESGKVRDEFKLQFTELPGDKKVVVLSNGKKFLDYLFGESTKDRIKEIFTRMVHENNDDYIESLQKSVKFNKREKNVSKEGSDFLDKFYEEFEKNKKIVKTHQFTSPDKVKEKLKTLKLYPVENNVSKYLLKKGGGMYEEYQVRILNGFIEQPVDTTTNTGAGTRKGTEIEGSCVGRSVAVIENIYNMQTLTLKSVPTATLEVKFFVKMTNKKDALLKTFSEMVRKKYDDGNGDQIKKGDVDAILKTMKKENVVKFDIEESVLKKFLNANVKAQNNVEKTLEEIARREDTTDYYKKYTQDDEMLKKCKEVLDVKGNVRKFNIEALDSWVKSIKNEFDNDLYKLVNVDMRYPSFVAMFESMVESLNKNEQCNPEKWMSEKGLDDSRYCTFLKSNFPSLFDPAVFQSVVVGGQKPETGLLNRLNATSKLSTVLNDLNVKLSGAFGTDNENLTEINTLLEYAGDIVRSKDCEASLGKVQEKMNERNKVQEKMNKRKLNLSLDGGDRKSVV